jgi:hypothetical protein
MAPFTHVPPGGGRFSDGTFGAYYAARELHTAVAETTYHRARFLAATREPPMELDMRALVATLDAALHDVRGLGAARPALYRSRRLHGVRRRSPARCARRVVGRRVRQRADRQGGECVAVFRPRALAGCKQGLHLTYVWDGAAISFVYEKRGLRRA